MEENQEDEMEDFYLSDTRNQIDQINLKNLKVSPVYGIQNSCYQINWTDEYDDIIKKLIVKYPNKSHIQKNTDVIFQEANAQMQKKDFEIFQVRFFNLDYVQQWAQQYKNNKNQALYNFKKHIEWLISEYQIESNPEQYLKIQYQKLVKVYCTKPQLRKKKNISKVDNDRKKAFYTTRQINDVETYIKNKIAQGKQIKPEKICLKIGVKVSTVYSLYYRVKKGLKLRNPRKNKCDITAIPLENQKQIIDFAMDNNNKRLPVLQRLRIYNSNNVNNQISYEQYRNVLRSYGFTYKSARIQNKEKFKVKTICQQQILSNKYLSLLQNLNNDYIVIDEMPVNLHCLMPKKIWELKNKKPIIPSVTKGAHITLIAAISFNHGVVSYQYIKGGVFSAIFMNFLYNTLRLYRQINQQNRIVVFLDNVGSHVKKELIYDLVNFDCDFVYNSPYSPVFSPIEEFFGTIKAKLINKETEQTMEMIDIISSIIKQIDIKLIRKYFVHSFLHMVKTIEDM